jgi:hypothetical protein
MNLLRRPSADVTLLAPLLAAALASFGILGADSRWLAAVGATLAHGHSVHSLPFASAPTEGWRNAPVLAELIFHYLYAGLGERGLILAETVAALIGYWVLALGLRREARSRAGVLVVALLVLAGSSTFVLIVRNALFSLVLFPVLLLILERDARAPSRRIWLVVPLFAVWSNLHGSVLVGLLVLVTYVVLSRPRAAAVIPAAAVALCVTPLLWDTPRYYLAVAHNDAARRGVGLWAPLGVGVFDLAYVVCALALLSAVLLTRPRAWRLWELVCIAGLAAGSVRAERLAPFALLVAAYPAVRAVELRRPASVPVAVLVVAAVVAVVGLVHPPYDAGSRRLAHLAAGSGRPVLAEALLAEQVELAGGTVWVADPIEAFRHRDQRLYLDWLEGDASGRAAVSHAGLVLVGRTSPAGRAAALDRRLTVVASDARAVLYRVGRVR